LIQVDNVTTAFKASHPTNMTTNRLIAIGASAGGPAALAAILKGLPRNSPPGLSLSSMLMPALPPVWPNGWMTKAR
jgi:chemotaxis response regulator CheB